MWPPTATAFENVVAGAVLLLPLAAIPGLWSPTFTPKLCVLALLLALGLPRLVQLLRPGAYALAARSLVAFLVVAFVSAVLSRSPFTGVFGLYQWGTGWLFWCAVAACFAFGATFSDAGRKRLADAVVAGALVEALIAVVQRAGDVAGGWMRLYQGSQADGLLANPVYLEALCIGGLALVCRRCCEEDVRWAVAAPLLAAALQLSHERLGIGLLALLLGATIARFRSRRALAVVAATVGGFLATWAAAGVLTRGTLSGAVDVGGTPRLVAWKLFARAVTHHPLLGVGPGQTRNAFYSEETLATVRKIGESFYFADAHDIVLEVAVTTGLLGLAALAAFAIGVIRARPRGAFVWLALGLLAVELVEPMEIVVVPLVALGLGAALGRPEPAAPPPPSSPPAATTGSQRQPRPVGRTLRAATVATRRAARRRCTRILGRARGGGLPARYRAGSAQRSGCSVLEPPPADLARDGNSRRHGRQGSGAALWRHDLARASALRGAGRGAT